MRQTEPIVSSNQAVWLVGEDVRGGKGRAMAYLQLGGAPCAVGLSGALVDNLRQAQLCGGPQAEEGCGPAMREVGWGREAADKRILTVP